MDKRPIWEHLGQPGIIMGMADEAVRLTLDDPTVKHTLRRYGIPKQTMESALTIASLDMYEILLKKIMTLLTPKPF